MPSWRVCCTMCRMESRQGIVWSDDESPSAAYALDKAKAEHSINGDHDQFLVVAHGPLGWLAHGQRAY